jgi:hypothetical protein
MAPALAGIEWRRITTSYGVTGQSQYGNHHVNIGLGIEF